MLVKTYTLGDSSAQIAAVSAFTFETDNPSLLRFTQGPIVIDCIGLCERQNILTLKIYLGACPMKTFRQTVAMSNPATLELAVAMAANRLYIHFKDLQDAVTQLLCVLKEYQKRIAKTIF